MSTTESPAGAIALRAAGLRVTASRIAVFDALARLPHAHAEDILDRARRALPSASLQSVYNALAAFVDAGLARRIEPAGHPGRFELRVADNHHHVVCSRCGRIEDVDCVVERAPCLDPGQAHGYDVQAAEVTFWGLCPACSSAARGSARATTSSTREGKQ